MSSDPSYPGVYIEEIPSGVRTITGVDTSITAFAGWAAKGPTDSVQRIKSGADYRRHFGGLDVRSLLSYSVQHFFLNGGTDAYIIRLVDESSPNPAKPASVTLDNILEIKARNAGGWGNNYAISVKNSGQRDGRFQLGVFNLEEKKYVETFGNLTMIEGKKGYIRTVINNDSNLIKAENIRGSTPPGDTREPKPLLGGGDGKVLIPNDAAFENSLLPRNKEGGLYNLDRIDYFNLLCVPGETNPNIIKSLENFCWHRRAFLIVDAEKDDSYSILKKGLNSDLTGEDSKNAAFYFPWIIASDPLQDNKPQTFPPSGFVAGIYSRTDAERGVWKAPAGTEATLQGVLGVQENITDDENSVLNSLAVNSIRTMPVHGTIIWGSRTLRGNDNIASEWKYVPVRRLALYIEESLYRGTQWVIFEPNVEPVWAKIRLNIGAFMNNLFRQGAFVGKTSSEAYFVKCDSETMTQNDITRGIINIIVGFAPLKPAEFVIIKIQQIAGQSNT